MLLVALSWPLEVLCHDTKDDQRLSKIGPAPEFTLTKQDGKRLALKELRGKVLAITFIFASCVDTCPLLTAKMAGIQNRLGSDFGKKVHFVSITVDPERDTPDVLKRYGEAHKSERCRLGVSHRHLGRDPRGRQALRYLLQENAARRRGPYVSNLARRSKRHTPRPVHGRQV